MMKNMVMNSNFPFLIKHLTDHLGNVVHRNWLHGAFSNAFDFLGKTKLT